MRAWRSFIGRRTRRQTCKSVETKRGNRNSFLGPTNSRCSLTVEYGKPLRISSRGDGQFPRCGNFPPEQDSIRRIEVQATTLIGLNHRHRIVTKKLVEIVQVTVRSRMDIRSV